MGKKERESQKKERNEKTLSLSSFFFIERLSETYFDKEWKAPMTMSTNPQAKW